MDIRTHKRIELTRGQDIEIHRNGQKDKKTILKKSINKKWGTNSKSAPKCLLVPYMTA